MSWITRFAAFALLAGPAHAGCNGAENACEVEGGTYHIVLPDMTRPPAVLWLHGAGGSGAGAVRNTGMVDAWTERGYAFLAADGLAREGRGAGWSFHPDFPEIRDESEFFADIIQDAADRFGIDNNNVILAGFSIGGSMTSYVACDEPDLFAAYAPVGGSFWRPHPTDCAGPVNLFHTHGWRDTTVPLEGRPLGGGRIYQGDVWHAMDIWRQTNGCDGLRAEEFEISDDFWQRTWTDCSAGKLHFALHSGAHGIPRGWSQMVMNWFEE